MFLRGHRVILCHFGFVIMGGGDKRGGKKKRSVAMVDCAVCHEPGVISLFVMLITCSHIFHRACILESGRLLMP